LVPGSAPTGLNEPVARTSGVGNFGACDHGEWAWYDSRRPSSTEGDVGGRGKGKGEESLRGQNRRSGRS